MLRKTREVERSNLNICNSSFKLSLVEIHHILKNDGVIKRSPTSHLSQQAAGAALARTSSRSSIYGMDAAPSVDAVAAVGAVDALVTAVAMGC